MANGLGLDQTGKGAYESAHVLAWLQAPHPEHVRGVSQPIPVEGRLGLRRRRPAMVHAVGHYPELLCAHGRVGEDLLGRGVGPGDDDVGALGPPVPEP